MVHPVVLGSIIALVAVGALSFVPLPFVGLQYYNASVTTTLSETCVLGICDYGMPSLSGTTTGPAYAIDWAGWLGIGFSVAGPCIGCEYKLTVTFPGGPSAVASEEKFVPNLFSINQQDTLTMSFAYVPAGTYSVSAVLQLNGATVATGSTTVVVG